MMRVLLAAAAWLFGCAGALAQQTGPIYCNRSAAFTAIVANTTLVTHLQNQEVYICGFIIFANAAAAPALVSGTGTTCATTPTTLAGVFTLPIATQVTDSASPWRGIIALAGQDVCINTAASISGVLYYAQQ